MKAGARQAPGSARTNRAGAARAPKRGEATGGVTARGLNPAVSPERQRQTFESVFRLGRELAAQGKVPVIVIDHRLTGLDDRPIIKAGLAELLGIDVRAIDQALRSGELKYLPGYTEQASDHWRTDPANRAFISRYPAGTFGMPGSRIPMNFMGHNTREANAVEGLSELETRWKMETGGKGQIIFAGSGVGGSDLLNVYSRPRAQGGGGLRNPDVRFGAPVPTPEASRRAQERVAAFNAHHRHDVPVRLDGDSSGKAGWVEIIEREVGSQGEEKVVAAFIDDRAHNRIAAAAASKLGDRMMMIKSVAPGVSFSQADNDNPNLISTFKPNP